MSSRSSWWFVVGGWWLVAALPAAQPNAFITQQPPSINHHLRVCADPNNLPFSNRSGAGFENVLAQLIARDLGDTLEYYWWPQRRAWVRHTVGEGHCDVAIGVPASFDMMTTTHPYYRSTYVFVSRADRHYGLHSLDDPRLRTLRIGLHFIGTDYSNPPPAHALGARGIVRNVVGYSIYGNYSEPNPPARLIDAVAKGDVDVAIVWGPLAGYFAEREPVPLTVTPIDEAVDRTGIVFTFPISVGVRKGDTALRDAIQHVLDRRRGEVEHLLARYGVTPLQHQGSTTEDTEGARRGRATDVGTSQSPA
jgi:quinoprotein dehydrogenase-associated probable ABC transporter substrate-binding protein